MTSKVVCGVDGSRHSLVAAQVAGALAEASGQGLECVYATGSADPAYACAHAKQVRGRLIDALGRDTPLRVVPGPRAEQLLLTARGASMLVLGRGTRGSLSQLIRPSLASTVVRDAAIPVLLVPDRRQDLRLGSDRTLVCAVRDGHDFACAASSTWLARELGLSLTLVHVVSPQRMPVALAGGAPPPALPVSAADRVAEADALLDEIACDVAAVAPTVCRTLVVQGEVNSTLQCVAEAEGAALLSMGPAHRRRFRSPLGHRRARRFLRRARLPVAVFPSAERALAIDGATAADRAEALAQDIHGSRRA